MGSSGAVQSCHSVQLTGTWPIFEKKKTRGLQAGFLPFENIVAFAVKIRKIICSDVVVRIRKYEPIPCSFIIEFRDLSTRG